MRILFFLASVAVWRVHTMRFVRAQLKMLSLRFTGKRTPCALFKLTYIFIYFLIIIMMAIVGSEGKVLVNFIPYEGWENGPLPLGTSTLKLRVTTKTQTSVSGGPTDRRRGRPSHSFTGVSDFFVWNVVCNRTKKRGHHHRGRHFYVSLRFRRNPIVPLAFSDDRFVINSTSYCHLQLRQMHTTRPVNRILRCYQPTYACISLIGISTNICCLSTFWSPDTLKYGGQ